MKTDLLWSSVTSFDTSRVARIGGTCLCATLTLLLLACNDGSENAAGVYGAARAAFGEAQGTAGAARAAGLGRTVRSLPAPLGANCMAGGTRIPSGVQAVVSGSPAADADQAHAMCAVL